MGSLLSVSAALLYIDTETGHSQLIDFFRPVSQLTCKPVILFSVLVFAMGLSLIIAGLDKLLLSRQTVKRESSR